MGEGDGRAEGPAVSLERWDKELRAAGFNGIDASGANDDDGFQFVFHLISSVPLPQVHAKEVVFWYNRARPDFATQLATSLEEGGILVHWVSIHEKDWDGGDRDVISVVDLDGPFFRDISEENYVDFMTCFAKANKGLLWLTRSSQVGCTDPSYGLVHGLARTARLEASMPFWTAELQNLDAPTVDAAAAISGRFLRRASGVVSQVDCEFSVHDGHIHVGRYDWSSITEEIQRTTSLECEDPKELVVDAPGMLNSMHWVQRSARPIRPDEVEVKIHAVGLNFRDIMVAMGIIDGQGKGSSLGYEGTGVVTGVGCDIQHLAIGDRVMIIYTDLFATRRVVPGKHVCRLPDELSFEGAATMILVYCTVVYAIINKGEFEKGQSILIHSACGGVGLAALQLCRMLGADIYATVGSQEKVQYLQDSFDIPQERIFNSRNTSFYDGIMRATNGRGVDLVLNSLSGELLQASWRCVARWGKMMEIGKRDILEHGQVAMDMFSGNRTFYGINLDEMFERPDMFRK